MTYPRHIRNRILRKSKDVTAKKKNSSLVSLYPYNLRLACAKTRGLGRGDFVTLIIVLSQKAMQSEEIFPVG